MHHSRWKAALATAIAGMLLPWTGSALAQRMPIPDNTLGEEASTLRPISSDYPGDVIEGGSRQGNALFHSFESFHVEAGRAIYFDDPGVVSILSRVTGGTESQILGLLGVFGDADLFLINPNGVVFGENARLDLRGGSLLVTTADSVEFGDGVRFDTSGTGVPTAPLLTVQPSAFLFNRANPAAILNNSRILPPTGLDSPPPGGLRVVDGERITLLGGDVRMDNGGLSALGGRVEVGGISEAGAVGFNADGSLVFPTGIARSDVSIANGSRVVASDSTISGGSVTVTANVLEIVNRSGVSAGTVGGTSFAESQSGDIKLDASSIRVIGSGVDNIIRGDSGNGGDVLIIADEFVASERSFIQSNLLGEGSSGNVKVDVRERVVLDNGFLASTLGGGDRTVIATGDVGGNIEVTAPIVLLTNGSQLQSGTFGRGNAGNVVIDASESVTLENNSAIFSDVFVNFAGNPAEGDGGSTRITTPSLSLTDRSRLSSRTNGQGNGGDIQIAAGSLSLAGESRLSTDSSGQGRAGNVLIETQGRTVFNRSRIVSNLGQAPEGTALVGGTADTLIAGDIQITAGSLDLLNDSGFESNTFARGDAGNITIRTRDGISIENSSYLSSRTNGQGNGGDIQIAAGSLSLAGESRLSTSSSGQGSAGNVSIETQGRTAFDQSVVASRLGQTSEGIALVGHTTDTRRAGDIQIAVDSLDLLNGSQLQSTTDGLGDAGDVTIRAQGRISIEGVNPEVRSLASTIFAITRADAQGRGGDVKLTADSVRLADNGLISTTTSNRFAGGNVTIEANTLDLTGGGRILTITGGSGRAGDVDLDIADRTILTGENTFKFNSDDLFFSGFYASTTERSSGGGGTVRLSTPELQVLDQARIEVDSQGSGTAGDMAIAAETVSLNNGRLTAETASVNGGNIALEDTNLLLLRNGSLISTTAGTTGAGGNGGNIDIDAAAIVSIPEEDNDIRANAFSGSGGTVRIDTSGLFGIAAQSQDNPLTSDITASSAQGIQGTVDIATPETDPRSGLTELPVTFVDASGQITQTCAGNSDGQRSEFVVTGRGGLPSSPIDALVGDAPSVDWAVLDESVETFALETPTSNAPADATVSTVGSIVEAQGWIREGGQVKLLAAAPVGTGIATVACR